jgi:hypothetical protein
VGQDHLAGESARVALPLLAARSITTQPTRLLGVALISAWGSDRGVSLWAWRLDLHTAARLGLFAWTRADQPLWRLALQDGWINHMACEREHRDRKNVQHRVPFQLGQGTLTHLPLNNVL